MLFPTAKINLLSFRSPLGMISIALTIILMIQIVRYHENINYITSVETMRETMSSIQSGEHKGGKDKQDVGWATKEKDKPKSNVIPFKSSSSDRPLILYAYSETPNARQNLIFFIAHGLHGAADFIFLFNGETDAQQLLPSRPNIKFIMRPNDCYDLGAYGEVLIKDDLYQKYKHFIMLNASLRGPFLPYWSEQCWSDMFLRRITDEVKLVGITVNCKPRPHIQSMIWATDSIGIRTLLFPKVSDKYNFKDGRGITTCHHDMGSAIVGEISASLIMMDAGYKLDAMMTIYHSQDNFIGHCIENDYGDFLFDGQYDGTTLHPYETIFIKTNRNINPTMIGKLAEWHDKGNFSSWERCLP